MDKPNRAERRKNKFGGGRTTERGGWPTVQPNPVFEAEHEPGTAAEEAPATARKPAKAAANPAAATPPPAAAQAPASDEGSTAD